MRSLIASPHLATRMELAKLVSRYGICDNTDRPEEIARLMKSARDEDGPYDAVFIAGFAGDTELVEGLRTLDDELSRGREKVRIITVENADIGTTSADACVVFPISEQSVFEALGPLAAAPSNDR